MRADSDPPDVWYEFAPAPQLNHLPSSQHESRQALPYLPVTGAADTHSPSLFSTDPSNSFPNLATHAPTMWSPSVPFVSRQPAACLGPPPLQSSGAQIANVPAAKVEEEDSFEVLSASIAAAPERGRAHLPTLQMPAPHLPTAAVPHTPRKRSRKACDNCRRHKCKCEPEPHHKSICAQCYMLGQDCTYNDESKKRGPPKGYIEAIETRVHHMERILADLFHSDLPEAQALLDKMLSKAVQDDIRSGKIVLCRHNDPSRRPAQRSNTGGKWKQSWWTAPLNRETDPAAAAAAAQAEASASMSAEPLFPSVLHASGSTISNVAPSGVPMLPAWERPRRFPNTEIQWTSMTNPMGIPPALGQEHAWPNSRLVLAQGDQVAVEQACPSAAPSQTSFSSLVVQYPTSPDAYSTQFYGAGAFPYSQYSTTPVDSTRAPSRDLSESPSVAMNGIRLLPAGPPPISTFGCQQMGQTITESGQVADVLTTGSKRKHGTAFQANFGPSSADLAAIPAPMPLNPIPKLFELKYPRLVFGDTGSSGRPRVLEATSGAGPQLAADSHPEVHLESSQETHGTLLQDAAGGGDALPTPEATPITSSQPFIEICVPPPPESAAARDPTASPEAAQSLEADLQEPAIN